MHKRATDSSAELPLHIGLRGEVREGLTGYPVVHQEIHRIVCREKFVIGVTLDSVPFQTFIEPHHIRRHPIRTARSSGQDCEGVRWKLRMPTDTKTVNLPRGVFPCGSTPRRVD